jgi:CubicO group peptidase (beta-lactamase class C family)
MKYTHWTKFSILAGTSIAMSGCILDDIPIGTGYAAKYLCSGLWVSQIDEQRLTEDFIAPQVEPLPLIWKIDIDESSHTVTVRDRLFGSQNAKTAYFREGLGCTLIHDKTLEELDRQMPYEMTYPDADYQSLWPAGDAPIARLHPHFDHTLLESAIDEAFVEPEGVARNTLSVAVTYNGELISERYSDDIEPTSPLLSWSMAKSITATAAGILYDQGVLTEDASALVPDWIDDARSTITFQNLLQMNAGLDWNEAAQGDNPDQGYGLFEVADMAGYYVDQPMVATPGEVFNYSTGSSNLIASLVQDKVGGALSDYYRFIQNHLFKPLNITSAIVEFDAIGQPVGGAFHYLSTRDWAKLGQLYLNNGKWNDQQILSEEWINKTLSPSTSNPLYGYQIWLNTDRGFWPSLPASTYAFRGFQGQVVMILPEHDIVLVRTGVTFNNEGASSASDPAGIETLATGIINSLRY